VIIIQFLPAWAGLTLWATLLAHDAGLNIERITNTIAVVLEKIGIDPNILRDPSTINYHLPPRDLPGFPGATKVKLKRGRASWETPSRGILEWDSQHRDVEVYNKTGNHQGSVKPNSPGLYKPPVLGRKIDP